MENLQIFPKQDRVLFGSKRKLGTLLAGKLGRSPSPFGMQIIAFQKVGKPGRGYVFLGKSFEFHTLCIGRFFDTLAIFVNWI